MQTTIARMPVQPWFELEEFMGFSHETRISSAELENLARLWEMWREKLQACQVQAGVQTWLAIWLPEEIEIQIDEAWNRSPGEGYLLNSLAQYMCMAAAGELVPQTAQLGCAPSPTVDKPFTEALAGLNVTSSDGNLKRRYAVLTYYPFRGGCEVCSLQESCPKIKQTDFASITLPGYIAGEDD